MKQLIVVSSPLKQAMQSAKKVVSKKSVLPILEYLSCETKIEDGRAKLLIRATDLENHMIISIPCETNEEFKFLIHIDELAFIEKVEEQPLTLTVDESTFEVKIMTETETVKAIGDNYEDFPIIPNSPLQGITNVSKDFLEEVKTCLKYVSTEAHFARINFQGISMETTKDGITFCATDATVMRLSIKKAEINKLAIGESFVLNPSFCKLISSLKGAENMLLAIMKTDALSNTVLSFTLNGMDVTIIGRNLDCAPTDYNRVLPVGFQTSVTLNKKDLQNRIDKAMLYANKSNFQGIFSINGKVILTSEERDFQKEYRTELPHLAKDGEDIDISFNLSFLKKVLADVNGESICIEMASPNRAAVIKEDGTLTLLMPIMLAA